jgi:hypothetical protein
MKAEHITQVLTLTKQIEFAEKQRDAIESFKDSLEKRKDFRDSLRVDITCYAHADIPIAKFGVPKSALTFLDEYIKYWDDIAATKAAELEQL